MSKRVVRTVWALPLLTYPTCATHRLPRRCVRTSPCVQVEVRAKRKSIGMEFATSELKKAEKPVVDRDYPPPITPHKSKPQQPPFGAYLDV